MNIENLISVDICVPARTGDSANETLSQVNGLVIVGANGSGKTRFGYQVKSLNGNGGFTPYRIGAQRILSLPVETSPQTLLTAEKALHPGGSAQEIPVDKFQNDYHLVMSLIFAKEVDRNKNFVKAYRQGIRSDDVPKSEVDKIVAIWNTIFSHRQIKFEDGQVITSVNEGVYNGSSMSDGERAALYLMGKILIAPTSALFIIDEPELHLHRAVRDTFWSALEAERNDSIFVYLTHDVDFASSRTTAKKLWFKEFNGTTWKWEEITPLEGFPDDLLTELVGSRRPILFVEGEASTVII